MNKNYIVTYIDQHGVTRASEFYYYTDFAEIERILHKWESWGQKIVEVKEV